MINILNAIGAFISYRILRLPIIRLGKRLKIAYEQKNKRRMVKLILHKSKSFNQIVSYAPRNLQHRLQRQFKLSYARTARDATSMFPKATFKALKRLHFYWLNYNIVPSKYQKLPFSFQRARNINYRHLGAFFPPHSPLLLPAPQTSPLVALTSMEMGIHYPLITNDYQRFLEILIQKQKNPFFNLPQKATPTSISTQKTIIQKVAEKADNNVNQNPYGVKEVKSSWIRWVYFRAGKKLPANQQKGVMFAELIPNSKQYAFAGVKHDTFLKMVDEKTSSVGKVFWDEYLKEHFETWGYPAEVQKGLQGKADQTQWDYHYQDWLSGAPKHYQTRTFRSPLWKRTANWWSRASKFQQIADVRFGKEVFRPKTRHRFRPSYNRLRRSGVSRLRYWKRTAFA